MQSNLDRQGLHVAIITDGNGRWGRRRGLPRSAGHRAGAEAVRRVVEAAPSLGVRSLTLFGFSSANWRRPKAETTSLMSLFAEYLARETKSLREAGVRLTGIGRRDRLERHLADEIARAEASTAAGCCLDLRIAIDYSSRHAIGMAAASWFADFPFGRDLVGSDVSFDGVLGRLIAAHGGGIGADIDLLIRTGGEKRLSDFLLWESAFAELCFLDRLWPDFTPADLQQAVADFRGRERTFGALRAACAAAAG